MKPRAHWRPAQGHSAPAAPTSFVGRENEKAELAQYLEQSRLVTVTGPGGSGKTRLALEVATHPGGSRKLSVVVDLAGLFDPSLVAQAVATAVGVGEEPGRSLLELLAARLRQHHLLVVLDNCEQVVAGCAEVADALLRGCPSLRVLATSQERLGITGEVVWRVPPLSLPDQGPPTLPDAFMHSEAVRLFCERAAALRRGFLPTSENLDAIVEICRRLEGNPLAIELAAAAIDELSPGEIAARLGDRLRLFRRPTSGPARHQSIAAALQWSYELCSGQERLLLCRLSVFAGGFGIGAAEEVCAGDGVERHQVLDLVSTLVAKSLVMADVTEPAVRYRLGETVRAYAGEHLVESGEEAAWRQRHADWCLVLVEAGASFGGGAGEASWLDCLEAEQDNLRAALEWALAEGQVELAMRLAAGQMPLWEGRGRFSEARGWLERVAAAGQDAPAPLLARALHDAGFLALMSGDLQVARARLEASLAVSRTGADPASRARTQGLLAFLCTFGADTSSIENLEADVAEVRAIGDDTCLAEIVAACGHARLFRGEPVSAQAHFEESLAAARRVGAVPLVGVSLIGIGATALAQGDHGRAEHHLQEGIARAGASGDIHTEVVGRTWLAELAHLRGEADHAQAQFEDCLERARAMGAPYPLARSLLGTGRAMLARGDPEAAVELCHEAVAVARGARLAHLEAAALGGLGHVATVGGDLSAACTRFEEALAVARAGGEKAGEAASLFELAALARSQGNLDRAASLHHEALSLREQFGHRPGVAQSLDALAGLAVVQGNDDMAARLFGAAHSIRDAIGCPRPRRDLDPYDGDLALLAGRRSASAVDEAWREGAALSQAEAVAYAARRRGPRNRAPDGWAALTRAEAEVVALVADGLTNSEIGERLFVSPRTVQSHLRQVYAKLGVASRRQLRQALLERGT